MLGIAGAGAELWSAPANAHQPPEEVEYPEKVHEDAAHLRCLHNVDLLMVDEEVEVLLRAVE
eukprot:CAMPEP_0177533984 /NCGR_PEP_ID=MMETSP0369-20130122/55657_1 /TAXON_ID=447022 ORGANISM="Scrippsiella hangoei-like, Strain SHHI-4" /NCGR_SAMPLE_ID=MMETSP0369 /ASSEMBLY_ACC=CAM_ASM_000364 /LENGTH=61 /DNA_ID=CAMNT_0019015809 /DNA_START=120 /DNA_END=305 /DNA_ORIENTATION=-